MAEVHVLEEEHMEMARPEARRPAAGYFDDVHRI